MPSEIDSLVSPNLHVFVGNDFVHGGPPGLRLYQRSDKVKTKTYACSLQIISSDGKEAVISSDGESLEPAEEAILLHKFSDVELTKSQAKKLIKLLQKAIGEEECTSGEKSATPAVSAEASISSI